MRILITNTESKPNPFQHELKRVLMQNHQVKLDQDTFWTCTGDYDIVHLQWPEELFLWQDPTSEDLDRLTLCLEHWSQRAKIVVTYHNALPHGKDTPLCKRLYRLVYCRAHAVVHMGEFSKQQFIHAYPPHECRKGQQHWVIPHPMFASFPAPANPSTSRQELNIPSDSFVLLVFGMIRSKEEKKLINKIYSQLPFQKKILLISSWKYPKIRGLRFIKGAINRIYNMHPHKRFNFGTVPVADVPRFFAAADAVLISRIDTMNSGNVPLAFGFGKAVIGPRCGNIAEHLEKSGNVLFDIETFTIENDLKQVDYARKGRENAEFAKKHWDDSYISQQYDMLFEKLQ